MSIRKLTGSRIARTAVCMVLAVGLLISLGGTQFAAAADDAAGLAANARKVAAEGKKAIEKAEKEAEEAALTNPLTGIDHYNKKAVGRRPVAIVVENDPKARPQWGIDDPKKSPDIIVEGEMEGGETRTLWIWADMTALPSQIGPTRSARPPYIRFAEKFDAIFIHCGLSHSGGSYTGADAVFQQDGVDHINMLTYGEGKLFGRDYSRTSMLEHTAYVRGENVLDAVKKAGFRLKIDADHATTFNFMKEKEEPQKPEKGKGLAAEAEYKVAVYSMPEPEETKPVGKPCNTIDITYSSATPTKHFEYNKKDKMYHTQDYYTDVARTNVLVLFDTTEYITNYTGSTYGAVTYTNYLFEGGSGKLACLGRIQDVTWHIENGKFVILNKKGEPVEFAPGKTWIGFGSTNHNGHVEAGK